MKKYAYEIAVAIVGGAISIIELALDVKLGFFITAITILLELSLLGMRSYTKDCLREYSELHELLDDISNKHWHRVAENELLRTRELLKQMVQGQRELKAGEITSEELRLIKEAKKSMCCTYYADSLTKLRFRLNNVPKYNPLTALNASYKNNNRKKIDKKRIFVLDKMDVNEEKVMSTLEKLDEYYSSDCIGFKVRYIFYSKLREINLKYYGNIILIDGKESTLCNDKTEYPEDYFDKNQNIVRDISASNVINTKLLEDYRNNFKQMWEMALPLSEFLETKRASV